MRILFTTLILLIGISSTFAQKREKNSLREKLSSYKQEYQVNQNLNRNEDCSIENIAFSSIQSEYVPLEEAIILTTEPWDWDDFLMASIPFDFSFQDKQQSSLIISLEFMQIFNTVLGVGQSFMFMPLNIDFIDWANETGLPETTSPISQKTIGEIGNRITIMEFKNLGLYFDDSESNFISFQVWFYENNGIVEYRYGDRQISPFVIDPEENLILGIFCLELFDDFEDFTAFLLTGDPLNPDILILSNEPGLGVQYWLNDVPPQGTIYRFSDGTVSVHNENDIHVDIVVSPNPFEKYIRIQTKDLDMENAVFELFNINGQLIKREQSIFGNDVQIAVNDILNGTYIYTIRQNSHLVGSGKLIKQF